MSNIGFAVELQDTKGKPGNFLHTVREAGFDFVVWHAMPDDNPHPALVNLNEAGLKPIALVFEAETAWVAPEKCLALAEEFCAPDVAFLMNAVELEDPTHRAGCISHIREIALLFEAAAVRMSLRFTDGHLPHDQTLYQQFAEAFAPELLWFMPDTYEIAQADNANPAEAVRALPDRCPLLVVRDVDATSGFPCAVGAGNLDWDAIFDAGEESAVEWYVCHLETSDETLEMARKSLAYLSDRA